MSDQPTVYSAIPCNFCQRVKIALSAKGVSFESVEIDLVRRPSWYREKASGGSVPLLEHEGGAFHGSAIINEYIDERWPDRRCCRPIRASALRPACSSTGETRRVRPRPTRSA